ncbi:MULTISPECIES: hypothetical protein [unclassified Pannonibacter]|uniref:hypothetical protein n=1 Tax=unclassified Pannonibacter TaxID=2627228 RepID=UPI001648679F|nr:MULTISPECIES: hypothetical protein [unclassified Pannonibacter]
MTIEILTTVEALKKNPADYDMVFAVEDFTEGVYSPAVAQEKRVSLIRVDHVGDGKKDERDDLAVRAVKGIRESTLRLLAAWALVSESRKIMIHCKNGEVSAALALFVFAVRAGAGNEDRAVAELFVSTPNAACDETLVGQFDDFLQREGALCDAWANGVFSTGLNPFRLMLAETRAWMEVNDIKKESAA